MPKDDGLLYLIAHHLTRGGETISMSLILCGEKGNVTRVRAVQTSLGGDPPVIWIPLSRSKLSVSS